MASSTTSSSNQQRELCRYFMHGACRFGSNCFNSHDRNDRPSNVCRYYQMGTCSFGSNCRYEHTRPKPTQQQPTQSQSPPPPPIITTPTTSSTSLTTNRIHRPVIDDLPSNMVVLSKRKSNESTTTIQSTNDKQLSSKPSSNDIDLSKRPSSFIEALTGVKTEPSSNADFEIADQQQQAINYQQLCPYHEKDGCCPFEGNCGYIHGDPCDVCGMFALHPFDQEQRRQHEAECSNQMEKDMEEAFATQRSQDKQCGICMEVVWEHEALGDQRFGILENCNHIFCLSCIRKWRSSKSYENKIVKACPECRVKSDYVTPSRYWFEDEDEKKKIIAEYKTKLSQTDCKYFKRGNGTCPFGNKCFYMHRYPDGTIADLPSPARRRRVNANGIQEAIADIIRLRIDLDLDDYDDDDDDDDDEFDWESELSGMSIFDLYDHYTDEDVLW